MRRKLVHGVGINDSDSFVNKESGWRCPAYTKWKDMLKRCYSEKYISKNPSYAEASVCDEWLTFSNFKKWLCSFDGWEHLEVDKDLLYRGNKVYSPTTCILVPHRINTLLIDKTKRGSYPLGVCKHSSERNRPFFMRINKGGKILYGSYFADPLKAHAEWQREKVCAIKDVLSEYEGQEFYDNRVGLILKSVCSRIEYELESGQETKYLLNEKENTNVES